MMIGTTMSNFDARNIKNKYCVLAFYIYIIDGYNNKCDICIQFSDYKYSYCSADYLMF